MSTDDLPVGTIVEHVRLDWGLGKIVKTEPWYQRIYVFWPDRPGREAILMNESGVKKAPVQQDAALDYLPKLIEKDGKMRLQSERITFQQAVAKFLKHFPKGFDDPGYIGTAKTGERFYKVEANKIYVENLGNGKFRKLLENEPKELVKTIEQCVNKVNLLYVTEKAALHDALGVDVAAICFLSRLAEMLEAEQINEKTFTPYAKAVCDLPAERGRVASWPIATIVPFLAQPDRFIFLKPSVTHVAAEILGYNLNYKSEPNWLTYKCLLQMSDIYKEKLAPLNPKDLIDVQSFFWVVGGGYG
jgi:hypothetical protein